MKNTNGVDFDPAKTWSGRVPVESVCRNPEQPRKRFNEAELVRLGRSLKRRQQVPCPVIPYRDPRRPLVRWMLVDGERRWRACGAAGLQTLWVAYEPGVDAENLHESSLAANFNREGHTKMDTARALKREVEAGKTMQDLAEVVGKHESWVRQYLLLNDLTPELQAKLDATDKSDRLAVALGALLAGYPQEKQMGLFRRHVETKGGAAARHSIRLTEGAARNNTSDSKWGLRRIDGAARAVKELRALREKIVKQMTKAEAEEGLAMLDDIRAGVISLATDLRLVVLR